MGKRKKKALDIAQFVLNVAGMIPVVGNVADLANAGISAVRGDRVGMALSLMSAIPIVGAAGPIAKLSKEVVGKKGGLPEQLRAFNKGMQKTHLQKTKDGASFILPSLEERMYMMKVGIKKLERKTCSGFLSMNCFTAGTLVQTTNGLIEIERITRGMYVWSQNPETGELGKRRVLSSSESTVRKLYHLQIGGCQLQTTAMHPFMVEGKGFVAAQDLAFGDQVIGIQAKGRIQVNALEAIELVYYEEPQKVYNFEVAEWHTYFIEELGILVHNGRKCVGKKPPKVTKKPSANVPKRLHVKGNKERYAVKREKGESGKTGTVSANKGFADKIVKPKTSSLSLSNAVVPWGAGRIPRLLPKTKVPKVLKATEKPRKVSKKGKEISLSKNNIQHVKKHTFQAMKEQEKYLTDKQLAAKLRINSFFNKNWTQADVIKYTQEAYNQLRKQGKTGRYDVKINGETITVYIKADGTFDTAYGTYKYTVKDFR